MMRLLVPVLLSTLMPLAATQTGFAARYRSEGLMRRAAAVHGVTVPAGLEVCASPHLSLGTLITVRSRRGVWRCIVGDVVHPRDRASILRRGIVVEVTPRGALRLCGTIREPPSQCPVEVTKGG
jgi:hypothetical protein